MLAKLHGRVVRLEAELSVDLVPAPDSAEPELTVRVGPRPSDPELHFVFDELIEMSVDGDQSIVVTPRAEVGPATIEHYVLDHAVPIGLTRLGDVVLHAAALVADDRAVLLFGPSGAGKSTASAWLVGRGWELLGDDSVRVEVSTRPCVVWPSYDGVRLNPDSLRYNPGEVTGLVADDGDKQRTVTGHAMDRPPVPVAAGLVLGPDRARSVLRRLGQAEATAVLARSRFRLPRPTSEAAGILNRMAAQSGAFPIHELTYRRSRLGLRSLERRLGQVLASA